MRQKNKIKTKTLFFTHLSSHQRTHQPTYHLATYLPIATNTNTQQPWFNLPQKRRQQGLWRPKSEFRLSSSNSWQRKAPKKVLLLNFLKCQTKSKCDQSALKWRLFMMRLFIDYWLKVGYLQLVISITFYRESSRNSYDNCWATCQEQNYSIRKVQPRILFNNKWLEVIVNYIKLAFIK